VARVGQIVTAEQVEVQRQAGNDESHVKHLAEQYRMRLHFGRVSAGIFFFQRSEDVVCFLVHDIPSVYNFLPAHDHTGRIGKRRQQVFPGFFGFCLVVGQIGYDIVAQVAFPQYSAVIMQAVFSQVDKVFVCGFVREDLSHRLFLGHVLCEYADRRHFIAVHLVEILRVHDALRVNMFQFVFHVCQIIGRYGGRFLSVYGGLELFYLFFPHGLVDGEIRFVML